MLLKLKMLNLHVNWDKSIVITIEILQYFTIF